MAKKNQAQSAHKSAEKENAQPQLVTASAPVGGSGSYSLLERAQKLGLLAEASKIVPQAVAPVAGSAASPPQPAGGPSAALGGILARAHKLGLLTEGLVQAAATAPQSSQPRTAESAPAKKSVLERAQELGLLSGSPRVEVLAAEPIIPQDAAPQADLVATEKAIQDLNRKDKADSSRAGGG